MREATGLGLIDSFANESGLREALTRRWCLIVSSKPIVSFLMLRDVLKLLLRSMKISVLLMRRL